MNRILHGQPHQVDGESTISELTVGFEIPPVTQWKRMGEFLRRSSHDDCRLAADLV